MGTLLREVIGVSSEQLSEAIIDGLVNDAVPEGQRLDFKSKLPGKERDDVLEFARDIAAMANAGGGLIVYGILDKDEVAFHTCPVPLGTQTTRLQQLSTVRIAPLVPVETHEVQRASHQDGYIILEIPEAQYRPIAVVEDGRLGYYSRVGRTRTPLSEAEVERLYRDRFRRQADVRDRLDELTTFVLDHPVLSERATAYVVVVPTIQHERLFRPTRSVTRSLLKLPANVHKDRPDSQSSNSRLIGKLDPVFQLGDIARIIPPYARPRFRSIELSSTHFSNERFSDYPWSIFHDDGAYLSMIPARLKMHEIEGQEARSDVFFGDLRLVAEVLSALARFWVLSVVYGVESDVIIRVGIAGVSNERPASLAVQHGFVMNPVQDACQLTQPISTEVSSDISELEIGPDLLRTCKVALDDIFTAFCWPECLPISMDGEFRSVYIARDARVSYIEPWASKVGATWTEERVT